MNIQGLEEELKRQTSCELRFDTISKIAYSVDASIYEVEPIGIAIPKTKEDLAKAVKIAGKYQIPIIPRGAATGITGGCLGRGLIIDTSRYLNRIIEINIDEKYAIVEPGVIQDRLNDLLAPHGLRLGPDTSTGDRATIGGMAANNSAGARSLKYGKMVDHVLALEVCLSNGEIVTFENSNAAQIEKILKENTVKAQIYKTALRIRDECRHEIERAYPKIPRRVSGYNFDEIVKSSDLNLCKLLVGSEGTLGIITQIKIAIAPRPKNTALCLIYFDNIFAAMQAVHPLLDNKLLSLELIDRQIIQRGKEAPSMKGKLDWLLKSPEALLVAEFEGHSKEETLASVQQFQKKLKDLSINQYAQIIDDPKQMSQVWELRKAGLGLLLSKRSYSRAIAFIEDISLPPAKLAPFMETFLAYLKRLGKEAGIYGHVGSGCMHIRPYIDLRDKKELETMKEILSHVSDLLLDFGGALSGEHGDGLIRSWLNEKMFGKKIYNAFKQLKAAFDPVNLMNPGKIVDGSPFDENLRLNPKSKILPIPAFLDFSKEGGLELSADLCNGNGRCRKMEGVMCPSFQATGEEYDTTRARAQALRAVIHGRLPLEALHENELFDVLDLCLECKGCKTECPSNVDMAKMKAEILYQYQQKHGVSLRSKIFGNIGFLLKIGSFFPFLVNKLASSKIIRPVLKWLGITTERPLPRLSDATLSAWYRKEYRPSGKNQRVVLFNDTYAEFTNPNIAIAAIQFLTQLGFDVILPEWSCCGRPFYSKGMLKEAKSKSLRILKKLLPYAEEGTKIIVLEPSCLSMLVDDYEGLLGSSSQIEKLKEMVFSFEKFIYQQLPLPFNYAPEQIFVHHHCHERSMNELDYLHAILNSLGFEVKEIPAGCCGMAGSFGYESEHYDLSRKIGELKLGPSLRQAKQEAIVVANGVSCRSQIAHLSQKKGMHLAELLAQGTRQRLGK